MPVTDEPVPLGNGTDEPYEPGWEVGPDDDWGIAVAIAVGRQLKLRREAVGMRAAEFGTALGYSEDMMYKLCDLKAAQCE